MLSWEVDQALACRRGYHILRIPCEHYHQMLMDQQQQQKGIQQPSPPPAASQRVPIIAAAAAPMIDNLTSCTIRTPVTGTGSQPVAFSASSPSQQEQQRPQPRRRQRVDLAIYKRMRAILSETGEAEDETGGGPVTGSDEATDQESGLAAGGEHSEQDEEEDDNEDEQEEEDEEDEDDDDGEEDKGEAAATVDAADRRGDKPILHSDGDQVSSEAETEAEEEEESENCDGFEIVSDCGTGAAGGTRAVLSELRATAAAASVSSSSDAAGTPTRSRARTLLAAAAGTSQASADRATGRSILKNSGGAGNCRQSFYTGNTYSSEHCTQTATATDRVTGATQPSEDCDTAMSRMRARQQELTRCVLQEQKKEQLMRQRQEMDPEVKEAVMMMRRSALQSILPQREEGEPDRWDTELPAALMALDAPSMAPAPSRSDPGTALAGSRRRVKLTGLTGLCRERRPQVAQSRDMQSRAGPPSSLGSYDVPSSLLQGSGGPGPLGYGAGRVRQPSVTQRLYTTEAPYNLNTEDAKLFRRVFSRALDPSVLAATRAL